MHFTVKISSILVLLVVILSVESFPQFSIPFVSWNKPAEENSRFPLNIRVQNPFSVPFGKNSNRQYVKSRGNNEVLHKKEKLTPVTPNTDYYTNNYNVTTPIAQTTPQLLGITTNEKNNHDVGFIDPKIDYQNLGNKITSKDNQEKVNNVNFNDGNNDITTDYDGTTESTTEYESTTFDDSDLYRSGVSGHVVASLLG